MSMTSTVHRLCVLLDQSGMTRLTFTVTSATTPGFYTVSTRNSFLLLNSCHLGFKMSLEFRQRCQCSLQRSRSLSKTQAQFTPFFGRLKVIVLGQLLHEFGLLAFLVVRFGPGFILPLLSFIALQGISDYIGAPRGVITSSYEYDQHGAPPLCPS